MERTEGEDLRWSLSRQLSLLVYQLGQVHAHGQMPIAIPKEKAANAARVRKSNHRPLAVQAKKKRFFYSFGGGESISMTVQPKTRAIRSIV